MAKPTITTKPAPRRSYSVRQKRESPARLAEPMRLYSTAKSAALKKPRRAAARRIAGLVASAEVWRFAIAHELIPHLETAVRLVKECFPKVSELRLLHQIDWDEENSSWIVIELNILGTPQVILEQYNRFTRQMVKQVPPAKGEKIVLSF